MQIIFKAKTGSSGYAFWEERQCGTYGREKILSQKPRSWCHGESGIPELLYPHTKFPSEYCTPVHDSLVNPVQGYNIRVVD